MYDFFILRFALFDDGVVAFESEKKTFLFFYRVILIF